MRYQSPGDDVNTESAQWAQQLPWWVMLQRRIDVPGLTLLTVTVMSLGIFSLGFSSPLICALLMAPIALLALVRGWVAGILVAMICSFLTAPTYIFDDNPRMHPALEPTGWLLLTGGYLVLGILVGVFGNLARRRQQAQVAEIEAQLQRAQASAQRYEALLEEMSVGQERLMRMNEELALLNGIATSVNSSLDLDSIMDTTMAQLGTMLHVDLLGVYWLNAGDILLLEAARPAGQEVGAYAGRIGEGVLGRTLQAQHPLRLTSESETMPRLPGFTEAVSSLIVVPLRMGARTLGVLALGRFTGEDFTEDDLNFLGSLARVLALAIENAKLLERAQELSLSDELTGLGNRRLFNLRLGAEIARAKSTGTPLCLVAFDLDFFKRVNDEHGHLAGDEVLKGFAKLVQQDIRNVDFCCRIGGEEFALPIIDTVLLEAYAIAQRIVRHVAETPFPVEEGKALSMTVSAGVAMLDSTIDCVEAFVDAADRALYAAKKNGRNRVEVFTPSLEAPPPKVNEEPEEPVGA